MGATPEFFRKFQKRLLKGGGAGVCRESRVQAYHLSHPLPLGTWCNQCLCV